MTLSTKQQTEISNIILKTVILEWFWDTLPNSDLKRGLSVIKNSLVSIIMLASAQTACIATEQSKIQRSSPSTEERTVYKDENVIAGNSDQFLPGYSLFEVPLDNLDKSQYSLAHFDISYNSDDGIAHLQSRDNENSPNPEAQTNLRQLVPWPNRISFYKKDLGWTKLTLEASKKIFGEPRAHGTQKIVFYTFDAPAVVQNEKQLFHLDMKFDNAGMIESYRVRGMGIRNPQWVSS